MSTWRWQPRKASPKSQADGCEFHCRGAFYVGIGVCSHDKDVIEKASFSKVELTLPGPPLAHPTLYSTLETVAVKSAERQVVYIAPEHFEAPNWSRDGSFLIFNRDGHILRMPVAGGKPEIIDTGFANRCNNDHGISPDGTLLAISDQSQEEHRLPRLHRADWRWNAPAHHEELAVVLAWLVARRKDPGFRWPA